MMITRRQVRLLQRIIQAVENGSTARVVHSKCCKPNLRPSPSLPTTNRLTPPSRGFTTSSKLAKKGKASRDVSVPDNEAERGRNAELDPYDYSELESGITKAIEKLKEALTKTRSAGRISPEIIENLPVQLNIKHDSERSGQNKKEHGRIGDYATVVPKSGRMMQVFVSEEAVRLHLSSFQQSITTADQTFYSI